MNDGYGADSGPSGGDPRRPACDVPGAHPQRPLNVDSRRSIAWDEFCAPGRSKLLSGTVGPGAFLPYRVQTGKGSNGSDTSH